MSDRFISLHDWSRRNPLLLLGIAATGGLLLAEWEVIPGVFAAWAAVVLLIYTWFRPRMAPLLLAGVAVYCSLHHWRLDESYRHPLRIALTQMEMQRCSATLVGSLLPDYETRMTGRENAVCDFTHVRLENGQEILQAGRVKVRLPRGVPFPATGIFEIKGELKVPSSRMNPGAFDAEEHSLRRGLAAHLDAESMQRLPGSGEAFHYAVLWAAESCRTWIGDKLTQGISEDAETAGVIRAMALGVADEAQEEVEEAFRDSGTLHVFAVSGLHVGLLGLMAGQVLSLLRLRRSRVLVVMIVVVFCYAFITGWRPSAARSAWMVAVMLIAVLVDRRASLQNALGFAALVVLAADSHHLFQAGFQLSFGVLLGIAWWADYLPKKLKPWTELDPFLPERYASWHHIWLRDVRRWFASHLGVSLAAWAGSVPFIWMHFQTITPVAVVANLVLVPLSTISLAAACMGLVCAVLNLNGLLEVFNYANLAFAKAMVFSASWFASWPGANFNLQSSFDGKASLASWQILDMPDCGAAHHLHAAGQDWLFDTGHDNDYRAQLKPALRHAGVNRLHGIFLSHNDRAHIGATQLVARDFGRPPLYVSTVEINRKAPSNSILYEVQKGSLAASLRPFGIGQSLAIYHAGEKLSITSLHPSITARQGRGDDRAMVLLVDLMGWRVLWTSDAGWKTFQELTESNQDFRCDVLIQSCCETDAAIHETFLLRASPQIIIHSAEPNRLEQMMPEELKKWTAAHKIPLLNPSRIGSVRLEFHANNLRVLPSKSGTEILLHKK